MLFGNAGAVPADDDPPWNHNIAYHRLVLAAAPSPCGQALDVGCGSGLLLAELAERCSAVLGVDPDAAALHAAAARLASYDNERLLQGDVLTADLPDAYLDLVTGGRVATSPSAASRAGPPGRAGPSRRTAGRRGPLPEQHAFGLCHLRRRLSGGQPAGVATKSHPSRRPSADPTTTLPEIRAAASEITTGIPDSPAPAVPVHHDLDPARPVAPVAVRPSGPVLRRPEPRLESDCTR